MTDEKDGTTVWHHDAAGGDETEIVNPVLDYDQHRETEVAPTAWSDYQEDDPAQKAPQEDPPTRIIPREGSHSWRRVGLIAAVIFIPLTAVAIGIILRGSAFAFRGAIFFPLRSKRFFSKPPCRDKR